VLGKMILHVFDVDHGQCAMLVHSMNGQEGRLAMIDSGSSSSWDPATFIRDTLRRSHVDYLFITNGDQDHMSGLQGLWNAGITVGVFHANRSYNAPQYRAIKLEGGDLTEDAERYAMLCADYTSPVPQPFNDYMGGVSYKSFWNCYPQFKDTNNLSQVIFVKFANFKILFPGDLEKDGWMALLQRQDFRTELSGTTILMASHHGRESGFCDEVFKYFIPSAVVISDKEIVHLTQETVPDYRNVVSRSGVLVNTTMKRRHVLTTRRDGWIHFLVHSDGSYDITTERQG
jgi:beta-lactamase superfamily II metal-dependent hydrolase